MSDRRAFLASAVLALLARRAVGAAGAATFKPIILKGDYTGSSNHERQARAKAEGCLGVVEFHFNAGPPTARGGEVYYQDASADSKRFAERVWDQLKAIGLPPHGDTPVRSNATNPRTAFINFYEMPAILIESLFLSNADQADWLHGPDGAKHLDQLAEAIASAIRAQFPDGGTIGLSPGHAYKTTAPNDQGARCRGGDHEVDHTLVLVARVEPKLR